MLSNLAFASLASKIAAVSVFLENNYPATYKNMILGADNNTTFANTFTRSYRQRTIRAYMASHWGYLTCPLRDEEALVSC